MVKVYVKAEVLKSLKERQEKNKLEYFKRELLKVLEQAEKRENNAISKAIENYDNSMSKTFSQEFGVEKAGYGIGTIRVWKGEKYRKIAPGKWRKVYEADSRGARQSIAIIRKKIQNATSTDELLQIVMENTNRFMDADGKLLPIVEELKKAVNESKGKINAGKPSTQEQIEQFKKEKQGEEDSLLTEHKKLSNRLKAFMDRDDDENKLREGNQLLEYLKTFKTKLDNLHNEMLEQKDFSTDEIEKVQDLRRKTAGVINNMEITLKILDGKLANEKIKNELKKVNIENLSEEEKADIQKFDDEVTNYIKNKKDGYLYIADDLRNLCQNSNASIEGGRRWLKQHEIYSFSQFKDYVEKKINDRLVEEKKKQEEDKAAARNDKIKQINDDNIKTYTKKEIQKAFEKLESLKGEIDSLKERTRDYDIQSKENTIAKDNRTTELYNQGIRKWDSAFDEDEEIKKYNEKGSKLWAEHRDIMNESEALDEKLDEIMGPIAYYYLNNFEYEPDTRVEECTNSQEVMDLIKEKDWYNDIGKEALHLEKVDVNAAKDIFRCMERIFAIFPEQKGYAQSLKTEYANNRTWAHGGSSSGITFNSKYYSKYNDLESDYERTEGGFHPMGTSAKDIVFHEYFHVMTTRNELANKIYKNVTKRLKMKGSKGGPKLKEIIQYGVSEYATHDADEFGAESFCQALGSKNPTAFAIEVFKETLKYKKYMRGLV